MQKSRWILKPAAFDAVIKESIFNEAQRVLAKQRQPYTNEELLDRLRSVLQSNGMLSYQILKGVPQMPSFNTFIRAFGSLRRAFEIAGYRREWIMPTPFLAVSQ